MEIIEYGKIPGPFMRNVTGPNKNKLIPWNWATPEFEYLQNTDWLFTEKVDGTNIRIVWDGHKPEIRGRTDNANFSAKLVKVLLEMFPEELLEQTFGRNPAILFGEGYGAGIGKGGGNYRKDNSFILFDVYIDGWWLMRDNVENIARSLGIEAVPAVYKGTLRSAISFMSDTSDGELYSCVAEKYAVAAEGMVGVPAVPMFSRRGDRIIVKLKGRDLYGLDLQAEVE